MSFAVQLHYVDSQGYGRQEQGETEWRASGKGFADGFRRPAED